MKFNNISNYINKINEVYTNNNKTSLTDVLSSFRQTTEDFSKALDITDTKLQYSSYDFLECDSDEQLDFFNNELQLIECLVTNSIYDKTGMIWNWGDVYKLLARDKTYALTDKIQRKVIYPTMSNSRPIGENAFMIWNGLQIIDIDIKNEELARKLKPILFEELCKYQWFLGVCLSASKKSLHVWTKITPLSITPQNKRVEFLCNFRHKYSFIYIALLQHSTELKYSKDDIKQYMDMAMAKPQQGIFISSDNEAKLNMGFHDLRLDVNFESAFNNGIQSIDWITHPDLKKVFSRLEWFNDEKFVSESNINISNIKEIGDINLSKSKGRRHYKHAQRWQLANTLNKIFGFDKAIEFMKLICKDTSTRELYGDVKTASIHNKPLSLWAVKELNSQHGFNIVVETETSVENELIAKTEEVLTNSEADEDPIKILTNNTQRVELNLKYNQYLSDIKNDIVDNLSHITLLEAGAGYGKTEMIKAFKARTLLILPFTSTIKAKVEASDTTKDWLYYYGNKRPSLSDLIDTNLSMSMTIDKFSNLNLYELNQAKFEYIVIDESHLLFTSSYRDVMSPCIQRLANCKAKVIMMTGTPTGELLFFPNIKHIKVIKEDNRIKSFDVHMCPTKDEVIVEMTKAMAKDILEGKKILYPTNNGNMYFEQITGLVRQYLQEFGYAKEFTTFYYKKSNYGEETMENININKSIGDNDIIFCTTYLSVGVDITDRYKFSVYFNETWIPQDIEQFANRLRNNDLFVKLYIPKKDLSGIPINYYYVNELDLSFDKNDLLLVRDLIQTCNDMLERNQEESKYNPLILSLLSANRYLKYDENDCRYYVDETTYKLKVFEERYAEYSKQLKVMIKGMKYYGYTTNIINHNDEISPENIEVLREYLRSCRNIRFNYITTQTLSLLDHINDGNIDMYKELLKGSYELFKDDKYKEERENNNIYVEDIEILERNIPVILSLYKYYDCETIKDIYEYCIEGNAHRINFSKLARIRQLVTIEYNRRKVKLDFPIHKFMLDAKKWATENPQISEQQLIEWCANYSAKYANNVKDVVVTDKEYFEKIYDLILHLFKVVIEVPKPKKGIINIKPFELIWQTKTSLKDIYGGITSTKQFFIDELLDNIKTPEEIKLESIETNMGELEHTSKLSMADVEDTLRNVVHSTFDYNKYSEEDNSNNRFLRKQENTQHISEDQFIFNEKSSISEENKNELKDMSLFDDCPF